MPSTLQADIFAQVAYLNQPNTTMHPPMTLIRNHIIPVADLVPHILINPLGSCFKKFGDNFDGKWLKFCNWLFLSSLPYYVKAALPSHSFRKNLYENGQQVWMTSVHIRVNGWQVCTFSMVSTIKPNVIKSDSSYKSHNTEFGRHHLSCRRLMGNIPNSQKIEREK